MAQLPEARQCAHTAGSWSGQPQGSPCTCLGCCACRSSRGARPRPRCFLGPPLGSGDALCISSPVRDEIVHSRVLILQIDACSPSRLLQAVASPCYGLLPTRHVQMSFAMCAQDADKQGDDCIMHSSWVLPWTSQDAQYLCQARLLQETSAGTVCQHCAYEGPRTVACAGCNLVLLPAWPLGCCCAQGLVLLQAQPWQSLQA